MIQQSLAQLNTVYSLYYMKPIVQNYFIRPFTTLFYSNTKQFTTIVYLKFYGFWYVADDYSKVNSMVSIRPTFQEGIELFECNFK